jgi:hypothetical protein
MAERKLPGYLWNPDAVIASWDKIEQLRDLHGAELLFSHYPDSHELARELAHTAGSVTVAADQAPSSLTAVSQKGPTS